MQQMCKRFIDSPSLRALLAVQTAAVRAMLAMVTATDEIQFRKCVPIPRIPWRQLYTWESKVGKILTLYNALSKAQLHNSYGSTRSQTTRSYFLRILTSSKKQASQ